ncbi:GNAT family N-acetyltransferase [Pseudomonas sp. J452]|uniref:GNAT family N-acetyltransferase n=1 Tax=Pseudomonas sp. J452 TaxID=2898441 RepID=UPI0021ADE525|nr:GNAT family N-acetyltransferase [Pseudomonas sp. J452]UUY09804.1 GNAT family N-acetyltransferase [Pseudomonas sp. J452]
MRVVQAGVNDLDELVGLFAGYLEFYEVPRAAGEIAKFIGARLQRGDSTLFIARNEQGVAQGFVQLYPLFSSLSMAPAWLLNDLYVAPSARRQGVAEALMNAARAHGVATGACGLQLETAKTNLGGQALYEKLGYVRDEVFYTYWLSLAD